MPENMKGRVFEVVILGLQGAGKSTLFRRFVSNRLDPDYTNSDHSVYKKVVEVED